MTNMAAMPIYGKNFKTIFISRTNKPMTLKLCMWHWLCKYYQGCSNYYPGLTLTDFTPKGDIGLCIGNGDFFFETVAALGLKVA